uniref:SFRICE_020143 n=1 Tax=Spodoptera frugiperda TaxID=7108 RepID=A0A2H1WLU1_SPOFR
MFVNAPITPKKILVDEKDCSEEYVLNIIFISSNDELIRRWESYIMLGELRKRFTRVHYRNQLIMSEKGSIFIPA